MSSINLPAIWGWRQTSRWFFARLHRLTGWFPGDVAIADPGACAATRQGISGDFSPAPTGKYGGACGTWIHGGYYALVVCARQYQRAMRRTIRECPARVYPEGWATANLMRTRVPRASAPSPIEMVAPCRSAISRTMASPRPHPWL